MIWLNPTSGLRSKYAAKETKRILQAHLEQLVACLSLGLGVCVFDSCHNLLDFCERKSTEHWLSTMIKPAQEKCS